jgi:Glycine rich protein
MLTLFSALNINNNGGGANGIGTMVVNGKIVGTGTGWGPLTRTNNNNYVGSQYRGPAYAHSGTISEVIVYSNALTTSQQQQVEGYLASKWGFKGSLPAEHPGQRAIYPAKRIAQIGPTPYSTQFTPLSIPGCQLWLDATDTTTIAKTGSTITQWKDKSGNANNATAVGSPTYGTNAVVLGGSAYFTLPGISANSTNEAFFMVVNWSSSGAEQPFFIGTTLDGGRCMFISPGTTTLVGSSYKVANTSIGTAGGTPYNTTIMVELMTASLVNTVYTNGKNAGSAVAASYSGGGTSLLGVGFNGGVPVATQYLTGSIYEVIMYNTALTATQRQTIESYLAQKWNIQSSLPSNHQNFTSPTGYPTGIPFVPRNALIFFTGAIKFMSTYYNLSSYSLANFANSVSQSSATPAYIWSVSVPSAAKGKNGILAIFFNIYSNTAFLTNQSFDYGVYVDGTIQFLGDSTGTIHYVNSGSTNYMMSSGGVSLGLNGLVNGFPLFIPVSFSASASQIQIGIKNSSQTMTSTASIAPGYSSNISSSTGSSNTSGYTPQNTFTTTGTTSYIVPTTTSAGTVNGVFIYCWGAGGESYNGQGYYGGTGGFVSGYYSCAGGTTLNIVVGAIGSASAASGGGGNQFSSLPRGGGFSGVFAGSVTQGNAIIIAGGGGGSGSAFSSGGGGGYPTGQYPYDITGGSNVSLPSPGTQSAGGSPRTGGGGSDGLGGTALVGGFGGYQGGGGRGGGGGGGYYGGGGGCFAVGGGAGGSSYYTGITSAVTSNGVTSTGSGNVPSAVLPGGNTSPYYISSYGHANGGTGLVVIVPAVGTSSTQVGVSATLYSG